MKKGLFSRLRSLTTRVRCESGFTLIEIAVSSLIIVLIAGAVAAGLVASSQVSADQRHRSQADQIAQQDEERMRGMSPEELNGINGQQRTVTSDGTSYTVTSYTHFVNTSGASSCQSGKAAFYSTESDVTWASRGATPVVTERSEITPPAGGELLIQVEDQTGTGLPGVAVSTTAPSPDSASGTTDSSGCLVLSGLASGSYNLSFAKSGYVDVNGNPSPLALTATVTGSSTSTPTGGNPVKMGIPGALKASFVSSAFTGAGGEADAINYQGQGATYGMPSPKVYGPVASSQTSPAPVGITTATQLFPFAFAGPSYTNNYTTWAGKCPQMQPPSAWTPATASVPPTATGSATVQEPWINLAVKVGSVRVKPNDIKLSFSGTTGSSSCSDSWYAAVSSSAATSAYGSLAYPGQPFANSQGSTPASASGGYGSYTVCADYASGGRTYYGTVTTPNASLSGTSATVTIGSSQGTC